jgi:cation diffusion facilitator CzcD-associated flavoprotein CzcO
MCERTFVADNQYSSWKWPEIPGLQDFKGKLLHSASWDHTYDFQNKTVVVIGAGSSAIQIVPQLQPSKLIFLP